MSKKQEIEAQLALAASMNKLAETIASATDPIRWQKMITDAIFGLTPLPHPELHEALARVLPGGEAAVQSILVTMSLTSTTLSSFIFTSVTYSNEKTYSGLSFHRFR